MSEEIANCPLCGKGPMIYPYRYIPFAYECCGVQCCRIEKWNRYAAAMELARAVRPIVRYYDWIVSDEDGIDLDDVIIGSTAHPHFTGKDLETIKRLCEVRK